MSRVDDIYNEFLTNENKIWKDKFTWKGLNLDEKWSDISISKFFSANTDILNDAINIKSYKEFYDLMIGHIKDFYIDWCKSIHSSLSKKELESLSNFFIGAIGEFFFINFLSYRKCITSGQKRYRFEKVAPWIEFDLGIDAVAHIVNETDCTENDVVIQIKFWNQYSQNLFEATYGSQIIGQGFTEGIITDPTKQNAVFCWLGNKKKISRIVNNYKKLNSQYIYIDSDVLDTQNNFDKTFFDDLKTKLLSIK